MPNGLHARVLLDEEDLFQAYMLRYEVYCVENPWLPKNPLRMEKDDHDANVDAYFGVFDDDNRILATQRLIRSPKAFMIEGEYNGIVNEVPLRKELDTAEVSRLAVKKEVRNQMISGDLWMGGVVMMIYREVYKYCFQNTIRYLYLATSKEIVRLGRMRGFPLKRIAPLKTMDDGTEIEAVLLDWERFERLNNRYHPEIIEWFLKDLIPLPMQNFWQASPYAGTGMI